jgi:hypothetical protein
MIHDYLPEELLLEILRYVTNRNDKLSPLITDGSQNIFWNADNKRCNIGGTSMQIMECTYTFDREREPKRSHYKLYVVGITIVYKRVDI